MVISQRIFDGEGGGGGFVQYFFKKYHASLINDAPQNIDIAMKTDQWHEYLDVTDSPQSTSL